MPVCVTERQAIVMLMGAILNCAVNDAKDGHKGARLWLETDGQDMAESVGIRPSLYREMLARL